MNMSKVKSATQQAPSSPPAAVVEAPSEPTGLTQEEQDHLKALTEARSAAREAAEKALLKNELAELQHKNFVLQVYMKYKLSPEHTIDSDGQFGLASGDE